MARIARRPLGHALAAALLAAVAAGMPASAVTPPRGDAATAASGIDRRSSFGVVATVLVAGDVAGCASDDDERTALLIEALPGLVMTAGDNAYPTGSATDYVDCYAPTWGRFRDRTRPVPGNHDWLTPGASGYFGYFRRRAGPPGRGYYAVDEGSWRIYALASDCAAVGGCGPGSPQLTWLTKDLAARPHACVMAVWHHPRFSSGLHGDDAQVRPLVRALYRAGAELVVNGHDHSYERFAPARPDGTRDPATGIRQFVVGTGGAPLRAFTSLPAAHSRIRDATSHGVLRLTLGEGRYAWEFLPVAGDTFTDSGTGRCH